MTLRSVKQLEDEIAALEGGLQAEPEVEQEEETVQTEAPEATKPEPETSDEDKSWAKRYADLRRLQQQQAQRLKELEAQKSTPAALTREQVEAWVKDNPKAAEIVKALAKEVVPTDDIEEVRTEIERTKAMNKILKSHPDFDEITGSDTFHDWADKQPANVQNLIFSENAEDVIWALDLFKKKEIQTNPKKDAASLVKTKSAGSEPSKKSSPVYTESMVQKMSLAEYEQHETEILKAQKSGNFVYDLSAGAR